MGFLEDVPWEYPMPDSIRDFDGGRGKYSKLQPLNIASIGTLLHCTRNVIDGLMSLPVTACSLINQQCWIARIFSQNVLYDVLR